MNKAKIILRYKEKSLIEFPNGAILITLDNPDVFVNRYNSTTREPENGMCYLSERGETTIYDSPRRKYSLNLPKERETLSLFGKAYQLVKLEHLERVNDFELYYFSTVSLDSLETIEKEYHVVKKETVFDNIVIVVTKTKIDEKYNYYGEHLCGGYYTTGEVMGVFGYTVILDGIKKYGNIERSVFENVHGGEFAYYANVDGTKYETYFLSGKYHTKISDSFTIVTDMSQVEYRYDEDGEKYFDIND